MVDKPVKDGVMLRGFRLGKLGFGLVGSYMSYQAQNFLFGESEQDERQARFKQNVSRRVREEMGALKGPVMKLGQILSMQTDMLPQEALAELAMLQMRAPGMHPSLARAQFKSSLGKYPEEIFREFNAEPFAAASLGQVHRATTRDGEEAAVKIQYPAIRAAIENDFKLLRSATLPGQLTGHLPTSLLDEIQRGILEETDYKREADNLEYFGKGLSHLDYVLIPRVRREFSSDRVLTMSFIPGGTLADLLKRKPSLDFRNLLCARLCELFETQLQHLKAIHADQHPGNYLFQPDGRIGLIDFGCVKRITVDVVEVRAAYRNRIWRQSEAAARHFFRRMCGPDIPFKRGRKILPLIEKWCDAFYPEDPNADIVLDFAKDTKLKAKADAIHGELMRRSVRDKLINPEHAFVTRADMGLRFLLREIGGNVNVSEISRRVSERKAR